MNRIKALSKLILFLISIIALGIVIFNNSIQAILFLEQEESFLSYMISAIIFSGFYATIASIQQGKPSLKLF